MYSSMECMVHALAFLALCSVIHGRIYRSEIDINNTRNDVINEWDALALEEKRSSSTEKKVLDGEHPDLLLQQMDAIPMFEQGEMSAVITMLQTMSNEMESLRIALSNVKYQNHIIYKQLKRMNNKCTTNPVKMVKTAPTCPKDYTFSDELKTCLHFNRDRITWRMARERCQRSDGDLVTISDRAIMSYITKYARRNDALRHCDFWIGATDQRVEGDWRWIGTDGPLTYSNWNHNEPNNGSGDEHCSMMLWVFNWAWNDARCKYDNACYICQARAEK